MANAFIVYPEFPTPEAEKSAYQSVERIAGTAPYRRFDRDKEKDKDKKRSSFLKILEKETEKRRWETGDVFEDTEIGDPGFFFDYKM